MKGLKKLVLNVILYKSKANFSNLYLNKQQEKNQYRKQISNRMNVTSIAPAAIIIKTKKAQVIFQQLGTNLEVKGLQ